MGKKKGTTIMSSLLSSSFATADAAVEILDCPQPEQQQEQQQQRMQNNTQPHRKQQQEIIRIHDYVGNENNDKNNSSNGEKDKKKPGTAAATVAKAQYSEEQMDDNDALDSNPEEEEEGENSGVGDDDVVDDDDDDFRPPPCKKARRLSRMSKWAARLFDPNRIRGVIEPPKTIPLNDEFLQAFGRREKEYDEAMGKTRLEIDNDLADEEDDDEDDDGKGIEKKNKQDEEDDGLYKDMDGDDEEGDEENDIDAAAASRKKKRKKARTTGVTVKISNLKYTTTAEALQEACQVFGTVININLMADPKQETRNTGRAYVAFETNEAANACVERLTSLDGRSLRCEPLNRSLSDGGGGKNGGMDSNAATALLASRYFVARDISKKCIACGQPGHGESDCTNPPKIKPCPLCALTTHGGEKKIWECPLKPVCFHCGIPGHVARQCNMVSSMHGGGGGGRGAGKVRPICTLCLSIGHDKYQCVQTFYNGGTNNPNLICLVCGKPGHEMCKPMNISTQGNAAPLISCSNCGQAAVHVGKSCRRPKLEDMKRNKELIRQEWQRVEAEALVVTSPQQHQEQGQERGRGRQRWDTDYFFYHEQDQQEQQHYYDESEEIRRRAKSAPARPRDFVARQSSLPTERPPPRQGRDFVRQSSLPESHNMPPQEGMAGGGKGYFDTMASGGGGGYNSANNNNHRQREPSRRQYSSSLSSAVGGDPLPPRDSQHRVVSNSRDPPRRQYSGGNPSWRNGGAGERR